MDANEFKQKTLNALKSHASELDSMESAITNAAEKRSQIPNLKEVFIELGEAAEECGSTLEYYDANDLPVEVRDAIVLVQERISACAGALLLYSVLPDS